MSPSTSRSAKAAASSLGGAVGFGGEPVGGRGQRRGDVGVEAGEPRQNVLADGVAGAVGVLVGGVLAPGQPDGGEVVAQGGPRRRQQGPHQSNRGCAGQRTLPRHS